MSDDLFDASAGTFRASRAPLADRMRPRTIDEYIGQQHILGEGRLLRRSIEADRITSMILYGPPGTGKTTLARIVAGSTRSHFVTMNAVLAGVKDIRAAILDAENRLKHHQQRTILFIDEVHRFNKSQQDALLPHVENGTVTLIGATTENPYFEVIKALVSRSRIFELQSLTQEDLADVARAALSDVERGYGRRNVQMDDDALEHLVSTSNGDARSLLNALELAVETTVEGDSVTLEVAAESIQKRAVLYDKEGDTHYDTISAFIKSLRGSDPDASMYWMGRMLYAGEEPRFIIRRMLIFAAEDIGLADPRALQVAVSCAQAFEYVGLPEGRFHLAECCLYLATAPKSNSTYTFFDALKYVEDEQTGEIPNHLKDGSRDAKGLSHGEGYLYPHAYRNHYVGQQYLPEDMQGTYFYKPSDVGYERTIQERLAYWRSRDEEIDIKKRLDRYIDREEKEEGGGGRADPGEPGSDRPRRLQ
jgi:putative ATPase